MSKKGVPMTKPALTFTVKKLLEEGHGVNSVKTFDPEKGPGRRWFESFMKRNPNLSIRVAEYLHKCRANATPGRIKEWFKQVSSFHMCTYYLSLSTMIFSCFLNEHFPTYRLKKNWELMSKF